jgi:DNA polymerase-3 subunit gamma/tau
MLGTVDRAHVKRIAELLAKGHAGELLQFARDLAQWAPEYGPMLDDLAALLARVAIKQVVSDFEGDELHAAQMLAEFAAAMPPEDVQLWYQIAITGRRDLELSPDPATGFEMTLLRMLAFTPRGARGLSQPAVSAPTGGRSDKVANPQAIAAPAPGTAALTPENWSGVVPQLEISGITRQLAAHCALRGRTGTTLQFALDPRDQHLRTKAQEEKLAQALSRYCGESVQVEIALATPQVETLAAAHDRQVASAAEAARHSLETDATVKSLKDNFGATLQVETIRPLRNQ